MRRVLAVCILFVFISIQTVFCTKPFKTGLVLSGGGAKGFAHIGLLELVDSLQIQVDYITGTSMGAIVGGLYSVGYSAENIKDIVDDVDWNLILSNKLPLEKIDINQKEGYSKSILELPIINGKPTIPESVIEGHSLSLMLNKYFFITRDESDFNHFPIPIHIFATDIISGEKVELQDGYFPQAVRSSMAIPAFFSPVYREDRILVDGGVVRNFPVEEIKEMGADKVIGSYAGFRKKRPDEVTNILSAIHQSFALGAVQKAEYQKSLTDVLLDFSTALERYPTQSFRQNKEIVEIGKNEARKLLPQLIEIKQKQLEAGIVFSRNKIRTKSLPIRKVNLYNHDSIPLNDRETKLILDILDTKEKTQKLDDWDYLNNKIEEIYSYNFYEKISFTYTISVDDKEKDLNLFFKKKKNVLQTAVHFDTYELAGITLRYQQPNFLFPNSYFTSTVDFAQYYKVKAEYLLYLNGENKWWSKLKYDFRKQKNNDFVFRFISQAGYFSEPLLYNSIHNVNWEFGFSPNTNSFISMGVGYSYDRFDKHGGQFTKLFLSIDSMKYQPLYRHNYFDWSLRYSHNSFNRTFAPTKGNKLDVRLSWIFGDYYKTYKPHPQDEIGLEFYNQLSPFDFSNRHTNMIFQTTLNERFNVPITRSITLQPHFFTGLNFRMDNAKMRLITNNEYIHFSHRVKVGGYYDYSNCVPFVGADVKELSATNISFTTLRLQNRIFKNFYVSPAISGGAIVDSSENSEFLSYFFGLGVDADYYTLFGPVKLGIYMNDQLLKPFVFFNMGYHF